MLLLLDIDDTLLDITKAFDSCAINRGCVKMNDSEDYAVRFNISESIVQQILAQAWEGSLPPIQGATESVKHFNSLGYEIVLITRFPKKYENARRQNLLDVFGDVFKALYCVDDKTAILQKYSHADLFVDDDKANIDIAKQCGIPVFLFKNNWNKVNKMLDKSVKV